jgi:hypothetical protein
MTGNLVCVEKKVLAVSGGGLSRAARIRLHHSFVSYYSRSKLRRDMDKNGRNYNVNEILQCRRDCRPIVPSVVLLPRCVLRVCISRETSDVMTHLRIVADDVVVICLSSFFYAPPRQRLNSSVLVQKQKRKKRLACESCCGS